MAKERRIFSIAEFTRPSIDKPIRSVIQETEESLVIVWHVGPGQEISAHVHPHGQDIWTVISGTAEYYQGVGLSAHLKSGEIAIAEPGQVHGAMNTGSEPFIFISVVAPKNAGYESAEK
ncbi:MAG: cupin domain-containing protein [Nitrospirae bacterium]|nr:cupin domain-containing protein [Nitrospirota bacterium]